MRFWRKKRVVPTPTLEEFIKAEIMLEIAKGYDDIEGSMFMRSAFRGAAKDMRKEYQPVVDAWKSARAERGGGR